MSKKVLVISTSPRKGGNSDVLADEFVRGAQKSGNSVEKVTLHNHTIGFCKGCLVCQSTQRCVIRDDADTIAQKMLTADVIAFATPIYYYGMCGQMKTMLDRSNPPRRRRTATPLTVPSPVCRGGSTALKRPVWRERFCRRRDVCGRDPGASRTETGL